MSLTYGRLVFLHRPLILLDDELLIGDLLQGDAVLAPQHLSIVDHDLWDHVRQSRGDHQGTVGKKRLAATRSERLYHRNSTRDYCAQNGGEGRKTVSPR